MTEFHIPRKAILAAAYDWLDTPYQHQASVKGGGCDCLGLIRGIWRDIYGDEPMETPAYTADWAESCLLYTSPSPRDKRQSRMPSSA